MSVHFRREEEVLLPVLARHGGDLAQEPVVKMLNQHARIRGLVMELSDQATGAFVRRHSRASANSWRNTSVWRNVRCFA